MKERPKKRINSRDKGGRGEREVKALLKAWWPDGEFARTPGSGGLHTMGMRFQGVDIAGDITCTDPEFPFAVECKFFEKWTLDAWLTSPKSDLYKYWEQTVGQAHDGKIPLMVFRRAHMPWYVALPSEFLPPNNLLRMEVHHPDHGSISIFLWEDFAKMTKDDIKEVEVPKCPKCGKIALKCKCKDGLEDL